MRRLPLLLMTLLLLGACAGQGRYQRVLDDAAQLMNERPDTVIALIQRLEGETSHFSKATLMRYHLLRLMAENKCRTVFRSDSLQRVLTDYYDRHGTPNERMWAHYLQGRALADLGDCPDAIRAFQKAVTCADTTSSDCDLITLCAIFGQESAIFNAQHMPREQLEALEHYCHFSEKNGQVYNYIRGREFQLLAWYELDDTARCFQLTDECRRLYMENGMEQAAASVYPTAILILLRDSQYKRAKSLMDVFEQKSGLFDSEGNICQGREHYYNSKGMYYRGIHRLDSAEYYFRKLASYDFAYNYDAYIGLQGVYRERGIVDSVSKYSQLAETALDSIHMQNQTDELALAVSSFNYSKKEQMAREKTVEAENFRKALTITLFLLLLTVLATMFLYQKKKSERNKSQQLIRQKDSDYMEMTKKCERAEGELANLHIESEKTIKEKQKEIEDLHLEMAENREKVRDIDGSEKESMLMECSIVKTFQTIYNENHCFFQPTDDDWKLLRQEIRKNLPLFAYKVMDSGPLGELEQKVCILTRIKLHNADIALLLNISPQSVSNAKKKANYKLFKDRSATSLYENLKSMI